jgi:hypothetical protein
MTPSTNPKPPALKTFDPFRILTRAERARHLEDYLRFLHGRDGECDTEAFTLSRREAFVRDVEAKPVRWQGDIDETGFFQHMRGTGSPSLSERTVFLVAAAKSNIGEAYGVHVELDAFRRRASRGEDPLYLHLMFEERYHTWILDELCRSCGIEPERQIPEWLPRKVIHAMMFWPDRIRWILIFAGEVLGSEVFKLLRERVELFCEEPEVEARVNSLLREIWIDEVFHVAYLRAKLGPIGIRIARLLLPLVAISVFKIVPQGERIGLTRQAVLERIRTTGIEIPPGIDWMQPDPR